ncbi:hypothetical protein SLA2020_228700 [Shorea laevis]
MWTSLTAAYTVIVYAVTSICRNYMISLLLAFAIVLLFDRLVDYLLYTVIKILSGLAGGQAGVGLASSEGDGVKGLNLNSQHELYFAATDLESDVIFSYIPTYTITTPLIFWLSGGLVDTKNVSSEAKYGFYMMVQIKSNFSFCLRV